MVASSSLRASGAFGRVTDFVPEAFRVESLQPSDFPQTACASCPASLWFKQNEWKCFCNVMKFLPWQGESTSVRACDGREAAIDRYEEESLKIDARG